MGIPKRPKMLSILFPFYAFNKDFDVLSVDVACITLSKSSYWF